MASKIETIMRLLDEATPIERAEVQSLIRGRFVESRTGMLSRADFEKAIRSSKTLNEAAARIGVCRRTLQYHMRLLGLPPGGRAVHLEGPIIKPNGEPLQPNEDAPVGTTMITTVGD